MNRWLSVGVASVRSMVQRYPKAAGGLVLGLIGTSTMMAMQNDRLLTIGIGPGNTVKHPLRISTIPINPEYELSNGLTIDDMTPDIQNYADYLIIGGGVSAASAAKTIRALDPQSQVLIVSEEMVNPYFSLPLLKEMWTASEDELKSMTYTRWDDKKSSVFVLEDDCYSQTNPVVDGIGLVRGRKVVDVDVARNAVVLDNGWAITFGRLLLTSSHVDAAATINDDPSWLVNADQAVKTKCCKFRKLSKDLHRIVRQVKDVETKGVTVLGTSVSAVELVSTLNTIIPGSRSVQLLIPSRRDIMDNMLPEWFSEECRRSLKNDGVTVINDFDIDKVEHKNGKLLLKSRNNRTVETNYLLIDEDDVLKTPAKWRKELSKLELSGKAFVASSDLKVFGKIWCAGDSCNYFDVLTGCRVNSMRHSDSVAALTGRTAGHNMVADKQGLDCKPVNRLPLAWCDVGMVASVEVVGHCDSMFDTDTVFIPSDEPSQPDTSTAVIYYSKNDRVVGILLWNLFGKVRFCRQLILEKHNIDEVEDMTRNIFAYRPEERLRIEEEHNKEDDVNPFAA